MATVNYRVGCPAATSWLSEAVASDLKSGLHLIEPEAQAQHDGVGGIGEECRPVRRSMISESRGTCATTQEDTWGFLGLREPSSPSGRKVSGSADGYSSASTWQRDQASSSTEMAFSGQLSAAWRATSASAGATSPVPAIVG